MMTEETIREFIEGVILETRQEDLAKIRMANNSYTAILSFVRSLGKNLKSFERLFKKENGFFVGVAMGATLRREEHTKLYVRFLERTLFDAPATYIASAELVGTVYRINIYFQAPPEVLSSPKKYNRWFAENLEDVLNSSKLRSYYVHEFIHTLDFRRIDPEYIYGRPEDQTVANTPAYANAPLELNAYFLQAISNVRNKLKKARDNKERMEIVGGTPQEFVEKFMTQYLSGQLRNHLNADNRQRLMKRAATAWELLRKIK